MARVMLLSHSLGVIRAHPARIALRKMTTNTILLVEDEPDIRDMLNFSLSRAGFQVWEADTAESAMHKLDGLLPSLVIIDWMLPGMSGVDLARRLRRDDHTKQLPIIMLTARGEEADKIKSFDSGVDDYIVKPFSPRELIARVKALLRRAGAPEDGILESGRVQMNLTAHQVSVDGKPVRMGPTEFRLLELFMNHPDRAFDRAQLLDRVWGRSVYVEERTVDVHVLRLRKALKPFGLDSLIQTVRGVGYRFSSAS
jgi:two-component system phosphate regulon response regulator PhoB